MPTTRSTVLGSEALQHQEINMKNLARLSDSLLYAISHAVFIAVGEEEGLGYVLLGAGADSGARNWGVQYFLGLDYVIGDL